jgi:hypothetical protein
MSVCAFFAITTLGILVTLVALLYLDSDQVALLYLDSDQAFSLPF